MGDAVNECVHSVVAVDVIVTQDVGRWGLPCIHGT